jgi:beta-lactam-binding protein with PASTA domain
MVREARAPVSNRPPIGGRRRLGDLLAWKPKSPLGAAVLRWVEYVLIGAALVASGLISAFITFTLAVRGNEITVPNLIGSAISDAGPVLARAELSLRHEGNRFDPDVPADLIVHQLPQPNTKLKKGRSVKVWISLGPERRVVPRVEGETLQSAQIILEQEGFALGRVVRVHSEVYGIDTVIAQNPPAYEEGGDATEVSVLLSRGYRGAAYVMPDFIGRELSTILDRVRGGSLRIGSIRYVGYPGVRKGVVVRQTPGAGTKVHARDRIVLYVSKGS